MIFFLIGLAIIHACDIIDTSHFLLIHTYVLLYIGVNVCMYVLWVFLPEINLLTYLQPTLATSMSYNKYVTQFKSDIGIKCR